MHAHIKESDWKLLRELSPIALDRLCQRIIEEVQAICRDSGQSNHERYLAMYKHIRRREEDIAIAFDDMRRSTAILRIIAMQARNLLTQEEFARFSEETRNTVGALPR